MDARYRTRHVTYSTLFAGLLAGIVLFAMAFPGTNADADGDTDGDGYSDALELEMGKDHLLYCGAMRADTDGDGSVSVLDLSEIAGEFGQDSPEFSRLDQDDDGLVSIIDLSAVAAHFGDEVEDCPLGAPVSIQGAGTGAGAIEFTPRQRKDCVIVKNLASAGCQQQIELDSLLLLRADPDDDAVFASWSGCNLVTASVCAITVNAGRILTVRFNEAATSTPTPTLTPTPTNTPQATNTPVLDAELNISPSSYTIGGSVNLSATIANFPPNVPLEIQSAITAQSFSSPDLRGTGERVPLTENGEEGGPQVRTDANGSAPEIRERISITQSDLCAFVSFIEDSPDITDEEKEEILDELWGQSVTIRVTVFGGNKSASDTFTLRTPNSNPC